MDAKIVRSGQVRSGLLLSSSQNNISRNTLKFLLVLLSCMSIFCLWVLFKGGLFRWIDLLQQWPCCNYTLQRIDPYLLRGGEVPAGFHAIPWGLLLGNIYYAGFLPFEAAKIYFICANLITLFIASWVLYSRTKNLLNGLGVFALVMSIFSSNFAKSITEGNAGGIIAAFLLIAWALCDEHPIISGILIGFAMTKPQVAGIVCISLLMMKKFIPLVVGAVIDITAWFIVSIMLHKDMFTLLKEFLFSPGRDEHGPLIGLFTYVSDNFYACLALSMLAGIIFVFLMHKYLPKEIPEFFKIYPAFMAVAFWSYSFVNDFYILVLPALVCIWFMMKTGKIFWFLCAVLCSYSAAFISAFLKCFLYSIPYNFARFVYAWVIFIIGIIIYIGLRRLYASNNL